MCAFSLSMPYLRPCREPQFPRIPLTLGAECALWPYYSLWALAILKDFATPALALLTRPRDVSGEQHGRIFRRDARVDFVFFKTVFLGSREQLVDELGKARWPSEVQLLLLLSSRCHRCCCCWDLLTFSRGRAPLLWRRSCSLVLLYQLCIVCVCVLACVCICAACLFVCVPVCVSIIFFLYSFYCSPVCFHAPTSDIKTFIFDHISVDIYN